MKEKYVNHLKMDFCHKHNPNTIDSFLEKNVEFKIFFQLKNI